MTPNRIALAAATAAVALVLPATPAFAHGSCDVYADDPYETYYQGTSNVVAVGELWCSDTHDASTYNLTICLRYSPVVSPVPGSVTVGGLPVPLPNAQPVVCGFASFRHANGIYGAVYHPCTYLPGYYQTYVSNGTAGSHANITTKFDYSNWVFVSGANCGL